MSDVVHAETIYSYFGEKDGELSFETGAVLRILEKLNGDWWIAYDESRCIKGLVPREHLKEIESISSGVSEDSNVNLPLRESFTEESYIPSDIEYKGGYSDEREISSDDSALCEDGYMHSTEKKSLSKSVESIYEISEDGLYYGAND
eukprot:TCONS_00064905-protein